MTFTADDVVTLSELAAAFQSDLDTATIYSARDRAIARVAAEAPWALIAAGQHTVRRPVVKGLVRLPRPCSTVDGVSWILWDGTTSTADGWSFDGVDTISGLDLFLPRNLGGRVPTRPEPTQVQVTYTGGHASVPAVVKDIVMAVALRLYDNPTGATSRAESIGAWSQTVRFASAGVDDTSSGLLHSERKALRAFRRSASTVRLS